MSDKKSFFSITNRTIYSSDVKCVVSDIWWPFCELLEKIFYPTDELYTMSPLLSSKDKK